VLLGSTITSHNEQDSNNDTGSRCRRSSLETVAVVAVRANKVLESVVVAILVKDAVQRCDDGNDGNDDDGP
jgi:hypothetical protein